MAVLAQVQTETQAAQESLLPVPGFHGHQFHAQYQGVGQQEAQPQPTATGAGSGFGSYTHTSGTASSTGGPAGGRAPGRDADEWKYDKVRFDVAPGKCHCTHVDRLAAAASEMDRRRVSDARRHDERLNDLDGRSTRPDSGLMAYNREWFPQAPTEVTPPCCSNGYTYWKPQPPHCTRPRTTRQLD